jgi:hypothetical protein
MKTKDKSMTPVRSRGLIEVKISLWVTRPKTGSPDHVLVFPVEYFEITPDNRLIVYPIGWEDPDLKRKAKLKKALKAKGR